MKVQSKKDEYIVLCENSKEVTIVKNTLCNRNVNNWFDYKYVINSKKHFPDGMLWDHIPNNASHLPVISFDQWQSLPDVPKPEYDPKDVAFNGCKEFYNQSDKSIKITRHKKIIGYKLIKPDYKEAVREILKTYNDQHWFDSFFECNLDKKGYNFGNGEKNEIKNIILESGVLGIWFEEIYEKESITLKSGVKLSEDDIAEVTKLIEVRGICKALSNENQLKEILNNK